MRATLALWPLLGAADGARSAIIIDDLGYRAKAERRVFLDSIAGPAAIQQQFDTLVALAHRNGAALAIGHPLKSTLALLEQHRVRLVTVAEIVRLGQNMGAHGEVGASSR